MANLLSYTDTASEVFHPKTDFLVSVHGSPTKDYSIVTLPEQIADNGDWIPAAVGGVNTQLNDSNKLVTVNYAKGYKYRIESASNVDSGLEFYWGNATKVNYSVG